jgi:hypothetical protein
VPFGVQTTGLKSGYFPKIMSTGQKRPENIAQVIDQLDMIREDLLHLQRSLEKMERPTKTLERTGGIANDTQSNIQTLP